MLINGLYLFPLERVRKELTGYYVNRDLAVFSAKRGGLMKMTGSAHVYGRVYQMNGVSWNSRDLRKIVDEKQAEYLAETAVPPVAPKAVGAAAAAPKAKAPSKLQAGIAKRGWVIGSVQGESISLSAAPVVHETPEAVAAEMERLARLHPGKQFVSLRFHSALTVGGLVWA
jgi:hypothetical protein